MYTIFKEGNTQTYELSVHFHYGTANPIFLCYLNFPETFNHNYGKNGYAALDLYSFYFLWHSHHFTNESLQSSFVILFLP